MIEKPYYRTPRYTVTPLDPAFWDFWDDNYDKFIDNFTEQYQNSSKEDNMVQKMVSRNPFGIFDDFQSLFNVGDVKVPVYIYKEQALEHVSKLTPMNHSNLTNWLFDNCIEFHEWVIEQYEGWSYPDPDLYVKSMKEN